MTMKNGFHIASWSESYFTHSLPTTQHNGTIQPIVIGTFSAINLQIAHVCSRNIIIFTISETRRSCNTMRLTLITIGSAS